MLSPGSVFAGYRIERRLGAGGMGAVYLAVNQTLPRLEALKVLSAELSSDREFRARFVREADVAAGLDHPHIVSVYNRGQTEDGQLWIAMQFVDGTNASEALRAGTMTPDRAVHIVTQIAAALDYAHSHNVVHRDVKPANFLMSGPVGHGERVFLADFGIARALGDIGLTVTGTILGTVSYAAPEVLASLPFDGRADIYSLGCALFRLLTGQAPFPGANGLAAVMAAHLSAPRPRITDVMPSLPASLDEVIATAMAKDPAARFRCAAALAEAATAALSDTTSSESLPRPPVPSSQVSASLRSQAGPIWAEEERSGVLTAMPTRASPRFARSPQRRRITIAAVLVAVAVAASSLLAVAWPRGASESSAPVTGSSQGQGQNPRQSDKTTWPAPTLAGPAGGVDHAMAPNAVLASVLLTKSELTAADLSTVTATKHGVVSRNYPPSPRLEGHHCGHESRAGARLYRRHLIGQFHNVNDRYFFGSFHLAVMPGETILSGYYTGFLNDSEVVAEPWKWVRVDPQSLTGIDLATVTLGDPARIYDTIAARTQFDGQIPLAEIIQ